MRHIWGGRGRLWNGRIGFLKTRPSSAVSNTRQEGSRIPSTRGGSEPAAGMTKTHVPVHGITPSSCSLQGTRKQTVPRTEYVGYVSQARTRSKDNTPYAAKSPQSITAPLIISISYLQGARPQPHVKTLSVPLKLLLLQEGKPLPVKLLARNVAAGCTF